MRTSAPVLLERRVRPDGTLLFHLVNYSDSVNDVRVEGVSPAATRLHSPDAGTSVLPAGGGVRLSLELYAVIEIAPAARLE